VLNSRFSRDNDIQQRFWREITALRQLQHPNIVTCHAAGLLETGQPYMVLDFIDGQSLRDVIQPSRDQPPKALDVHRALALSIQIATAITVAHHHSVLHRDLNPNNILISLDENGMEHARIIDFGVAKILGKNTLDQITRRIVGTPEFMAPEQLAPGQRLDPRLDLWQLGAVIYFMLTGETPYTAPRTPVDLLRNQLQMEERKDTSGPQPSERRPLLGEYPQLDKLVGQLLSTNPERRPSSAQHVVGQLQIITERLLATSPQRHTRHLTPPNGPWFCPNCQKCIDDPGKLACIACDTARPHGGWPGDPMLGRQLLNARFVLLSRLHAGRFGVVYHAYDREAEAERAFKTVSGYGRVPQVRELFAEGGTMTHLRELNHPNVVRVYEVGLLPSKGHPFMVLEHLDEPDVDTLTWPPAAGFPVLRDPIEVVRIALQIASALEFIHDKGMFHHDLSPESIVLGDSDTHHTPRPQIVGLSNTPILGAIAQVQTLDIYQRPEYLAPEQFDIRITSKAALDVYQLGSVIHFMLTGWPPYPGHPLDPRKSANSYHVAQMQIANRHTLGPRPSHRIPALRLWHQLDELVAQMLSTSVELRPASMTDVTTRLAAILHASTTLQPTHATFELSPGRLIDPNFGGKTVEDALHPFDDSHPDDTPHPDPWSIQTGDTREST
ncbi:MAG: serine/threonine-protein kinase, partial [Myxococcota bacterium]